MCMLPGPHVGVPHTGQGVVSVVLCVVVNSRVLFCQCPVYVSSCCADILSIFKLLYILLYHIQLKYVGT